MQWLIEKSQIVFMTVKLLLPVMLGLVFWWIRNISRKLVRYGLGVVLTVYLWCWGYMLGGLLIHDRKEKYMCGRYSFAKPNIERLSLVQLEFDFEPRYNISPSQTVPVVIHQNGGNRLLMFRWGL